MSSIREDAIAAACAALRALGPYPPALTHKLAADDPDAMREAVTLRLDAGRTEGLRALVEGFREIGEFGVWARMQSARMHRDEGEFAQALAELDDLQRRFPQRAAPHWDIARARCLIGLNRLEEAQAQMRASVARYPDVQAPRAFLAGLLSRKGCDAEALQVWRELHAAFAAPDLDAWLGLAGALQAVGEDAQAAQALERARAIWPEEARLLRDLAALRSAFGQAAEARDLRVALMARHAETARPEAWAALARAHHDLGEAQAGAAALAELERRFPASPLATAERLRFAKERETGLDGLQELVAAARRLFPDDFELRGAWVWLLLSLGRIGEAERETRALEAEGAAGIARVARLRVEADKGEETLREFLARWDWRGWSAQEAMQVGYALLEIRAPWAFAFGEAALADAMARFAQVARLKPMRARFLIALRRDQEAVALIDAIPPCYARRDVLELRAWAQTHRGRHETAKRLWTQALAGAYYAAVHAPIHRLERISPDDWPPPGEGVSAYVVFRNEAAQIGDFLAYHRRLGVRRFVLLDHGSDDGGRALALAEPDVILYDCPDSYQLSWSGRRWVNEIVAREGRRGWGLQLDMDERLIYPGCETLSLDGFVRYLDARGFEAARGFMLDVFAQTLVDAGGAPPFGRHVWYDDDYETFGLARPPYLSLAGGVRSRLFEAKEFLHKVPLWRLDAGLLLNSHETTAMRFADVSTALKHYKLLNVALQGREAAGTGVLEPDTDVETVRRHARYAARLERLWSADLKGPASRELEDSLALAARGLMTASPEYRAWLAGA